ncbi:integrase, catalytic region, zinc finger, CCHC-type containing protein [Tanacetum coccineum]|uniref:Integrase, catalytic region, zinc finger, CCHC-type containing protein n=1 Tax=Tanacetum coccineum TaxID=301880 RepID=A0ABQ4YDA8_9ASTR
MVREIVEEARVVKPLDSSLHYACQYTKLSQELLECVIGTCPKSFHEEISRPHLPYIGYQWRPTGKKLTLGKLDCGSQWRPTGKKFALGEMCHLTKLSVKCRTGHALVSGLRLLKTYDGESFKAHEFLLSSWVSRFGMITLGVIMGQFCDSDLEVAFRKHTCFVRDINGTDILKGSRGTNLYTISIDEMMKSSLICLLSKASKSKSWLWHRRLNHLNFGTINDLARKNWFRESELSKEEISFLVIVVTYSRFTWVKFLRTKDETPEFVTNFLKQYRLPQQNSLSIRTENGRKSSTNCYKMYRTLRGRSTYNDVTLESSLVLMGESSTSRKLQEGTHSRDTPTFTLFLHPLHINLVSVDPGSAQSSSGNVNAAEPANSSIGGHQNIHLLNAENQDHDHLQMDVKKCFSNGDLQKKTCQSSEGI